MEENLQLGRTVGRAGPWTVNRDFEVFPNLVKRRHARTANLSGGEQQATAIGRALVSIPDLLILDEVSLGLSPRVVDEVYASLAELWKSGTTTILVEQDLGRAMRVGTRAVCMLEGQIPPGPTDKSSKPRRDHRRLFRPRSRRRDKRGAPMMSQFVQAVLLDGYYALIACGLAFMFQVMRVINLAHGSLANPVGLRRLDVGRTCRSVAADRRRDRRAGYGAGRTRSATRSPRAQRARRRAAPDPHHVRPFDRPRQPALSAVRAGRPVAVALRG